MKSPICSGRLGVHVLADLQPLKHFDQKCKWSDFPFGWISMAAQVIDHRFAAGWQEATRIGQM